MFALINRWRVVPGLKAQFEAGWRRSAPPIAAEFGGWGARLHAAGEGVYIACARWPGAATWKKATETCRRHCDDRARGMYSSAFRLGRFETLASAPVVADPLELCRS